MSLERWILAIDPGIDVSGWACYAIPERPLIQDSQYRAAYRAHGSLRSRSRDPMARRLLDLHRGLYDVLQQFPEICAVFIELPAIAGDYKRNAAKTKGRGFMAQTMGITNRATGALMLSLRLSGFEAHEIPALPTPKELKQAWAIRIWPALGDGASNGDERDALHLGGWIMQRPHLWPKPEAQPV